MAKTYFNKSIKPTDGDLEKILNETFQFYNELNELTRNFIKEWIFSKRSGWMLKVHDKKKALYYLIPLESSFRLSLAIRETEKKTLIQNKELIEIKEQIIAAKKYSEGFALQFTITDSTSFIPIRKFIELLIKMRK